MYSSCSARISSADISRGGLSTGFIVISLFQFSETPWACTARRTECSTPGSRGLTIPDPTIDHHLLVSEEIDGVAALTVQVPEKGFLPPREGEVSHRRRHPHVDADVTGVRLVLEAPSRPSVLRVDAGRVAERASGNDLEGLVEGFHLHDAGHRPEDLFSGDGHVWSDLVKDRGPHEEAALTAGGDDLRISPIENQFSPLRQPLFYVGMDPLLGGPRDHRTHIHPLVQAVADREWGSSRQEGLPGLLVRLIAH